MPAFRTQFEGKGTDPQGRTVPAPPHIPLQIGGPVIQIIVAVPPPYALKLQQQGHPIPPPVQGSALLDTGATNTCIDQAVLETQLGLTPTGMGTQLTAAGPAPAPYFACMLGIPVMGSAQQFLPSVTGAQLQGQPYIGLLGRDFLAGKILIYDGLHGTITISW